MNTYFFTYGTSEVYPFEGGWTQISAESHREACVIHARMFGVLEGPMGRFAHSYTEEMWAKTDMGSTGNCGAFCHMVL